MYTAFYGLREKPFALSPDPRFLFLAESHREALAHLLYGIEQGEGFIAVTGEVGTGKTTLCRTLLRRLGPEVEVAFLFNPLLSARELIEAIHTELGIESLGDTLREKMDELNRFLLDRQREGRRVLLIVDEAQGLGPQTLEQIRLLSNLETESHKLIQILLLGQPELDQTLESPSLRQLRQRIGVRWHLGPLASHETRAYVRHRLRVAAGSPRELFTEAALREVHRRSRGVPRLVNLLCDRALLAGYAERAPRIGRRLVRKAARELRGGVDRGWRPRRRSAWLAAGAVALLGLGALGWRLGWVERWQEATAQGPAAGVAPVAAPAPSAGSEPSEAAREPEAPVAAPRAAPASSRAAVPGLWPLELDAPSPDRAASGEARAPQASPATLEALAHALALRPPGATAGEALAAVLSAWERPGPRRPGEIVSFPEALGILSHEQLALLPLPRADLGMLRALDHPALLELRAADGVERVVALLALAPGRARVAGVVPEGPIWVSIAALEALAGGSAYVVWHDFEGLPELLRAGDAGEAVAWLQFSLRELGFYPGTPSGRFDAATLAAVRAFQADHGLEADGTVGPLTKMALYEALPRYPVPRLAAAGGERG